MRFPQTGHINLLCSSKFTLAQPDDSRGFARVGSGIGHSNRLEFKAKAELIIVIIGVHRKVDWCCCCCCCRRATTIRNYSRRRFVRRSDGNHELISPAVCHFQRTAEKRPGPQVRGHCFHPLPCRRIRPAESRDESHAH